MGKNNASAAGMPSQRPGTPPDPRAAPSPELPTAEYRELSEKRFHDMAASVPVGIYLTDPQGNCTYANRTWCAAAGMSPDEARGQGWIQGLHPDDRAAIAEKWYRSAQSNGHWGFEYRFQDRTGRVTWVYGTAAPVRAADGTVTGYVGTNVNITARKQAEQALQESEALFRSLFEDSVAGISQTLPDGRLIRANLAYARMYGYATAEQMLAEVTNVGQLYANPEDRQEVRRIITTEDFMAPREITVVRRDGTHFVVLVGAKGIKDANGRLLCYQATHVDITERKRAEEELRLANAHLARAQQSAGAGLWDWDLATETLTWSPELFRLFGLDPDTSRATFATWRRVLHPSDVTAAEEQIRAALQNRQRLVNEYRIVRPSGEERWIFATGDTEYAADGRPVRMSGVCIDITERHETEDRHRSLFEGMLNGAAYCRMLFDGERPQDFIYLAVNRAFEAQTGLHNVAGRKVTEVIPGIREADPQLFEIYGRVARTGVPARFETYVVALQMWFEISVYSPAPDHFVTVFDVITARKQAEAELRHHVTRESAIARILRLSLVGGPLDDVLHSALMSILAIPECALDPRGAVFLIAEAPDVLVLRAQHGFTPALQAACARVAFRTCLCGRAARSGQLEFADGINDHHETRCDGMAPHGHYCVPLRFGDHTIGVLNVYVPHGHVRTASTEQFLVGVADALAGVVARRQTEEALREKDREYRHLIENLMSGIVVHAPDTSILLSNPMASQLLGLTPDQMRGKTACDPAWCFVRDDGTPMPLAEYPVNRVLASGGPVLDQVLGIRRPDRADSTWVLCNAYSVPDAAGRAAQVVVTFGDITRLKRAEAERETMERQLRQAQKMEAVGRLAGGVAHDFNNKLQTILGITELLANATAPDDPRAADLKDIMVAARGSADLTRQLLAFARRQTITPKVLDLNDTVAGMLRMLARLIGEDVNLAWWPGSGLWPVKMDPSQLDQLLANLAVNARDAIAGVGNLSIATGNITVDAAYCQTHPDATPGAYVMLSVSDDGCGMDTETLARIFEPFFTTKPMGQGTGLGLATVYGIVRQNNGFIDVRSAPGKGTTFAIHLPRHAAPATAVSAALEPVIATGTGTVLLVEDEAPLLRLAGRLLEGLGYTVLAADGPREALRLAAEYPGDIDLLLTDVVMPDMSGRDLRDRLSATRPGMKCLFMSGYTADAIAHRGVLDAGLHFIAKPFSVAEIAAKLHAVLAGEGGSP